jgi:hypothetical protein
LLPSAALRLLQGSQPRRQFFRGSLVWRAYLVDLPDRIDEVLDHAPPLGQGRSCHSFLGRCRALQRQDLSKPAAERIGDRAVQLGQRRFQGVAMRGGGVALLPCFRERICGQRNLLLAFGKFLGEFSPPSPKNVNIRLL